jgi:phage tail-like protein
MSATNQAAVFWSQTNFRVIIGDVELGCTEMSGLGSQTVPGTGGAAVNEPSKPATGATATGTPWDNSVGPWIGAGLNRASRGSPIPALQWTLTPVILRRALDHSHTLFAWRSAVVAGQPDTRDVLIQLLDAPGGPPVLAWKLYDAWPLSWSGPVLDALAPGVALEQAELAYARLQWLDNPETGEA